MLFNRRSLFVASLALSLFFPAVCATAGPPIFTTLHQFGGTGDGSGPAGIMVTDANGVLYGTTKSGGAYGFGAVFSLTPPSSPGQQWSETILWSFGSSSNDGRTPVAGVVLGDGGVLYGTTQYSDPSTGNAGTVFALAPPTTPGGSWTESILYDFTGNNNGRNGDGAGPNSLVLGPNGVLYGTTLIGEPSEHSCLKKFCGTVFSLTPPAASGGAWTEAILWYFNMPSDGDGPNSELTIGPGGVLYGTTEYGGAYSGCTNQCDGTVYAISPPSTLGGPWTETVVWSFGGSPGGGGDPFGVVIGRNGRLFTVTQYSDTSYKRGEVVSFLPPKSAGKTWTEQILYSFEHPKLQYPQGERPMAGLVMRNGALYGTTAVGGNAGVGTVFRIAPPTAASGKWRFSVLHQFAVLVGLPAAGLASGPGETLYGSTTSGGAGGAGGTVFSLAP